MKIWTLKFSSYQTPDDIFNLIVSGKKTIETRSRNPNDGDKDYSNVAVGDVLHIISLDTGKEIKKTVLFNHLYNSVGEMVNNEDIERILPGIGSKDDYLKVIEEVKSKWGDKYRFELENYGMVAIGFK